LEIFEATLGLLSIALLLSGIAGKLQVPYPSLLVIGGLVLGLLGPQPFALSPSLAFALFLPPILFEAAFYTSWRDFRANLRPITSLAIGLVGLSTWVVAMVAHRLIPELPLGAAIVLGAIVSPPDAAAATAVLRRLRLPRRLSTIVEGESLMNDAVALVIYNFAVASVVTGQFSPSAAVLALAGSVTGSVILGVGIGWGLNRLIPLITDPLISVAAGFIAAFSTYLAAEQVDVSGVLTVVAAGLFLAWRSPVNITADVRLSGTIVWRLVIFLLNAVAFILIGLQLPGIVAELRDFSTIRLAEDAAIIGGTVIGVRLVWVMTLSQTVRFLGGARARRNIGDWREALVIGWSGMRGLVSLAAALALPHTIADGSVFPARALILFLSFSVILATLVVQGLSLGLLIRLVGLKDDDREDQEERMARIEGANAAIAAIDRLAETPALPREVLDRQRQVYLDRLQQANDDGQSGTSDRSNSDFADAVLLTAIHAERHALLALRQRQALGDETLRKIQRELDLAEITIKRRRPAYSKATWLDIAHHPGARRHPKAAP
jgi:CPA1 family monovalent cation:H+ antiporter